jgi:hypothetical protein
LRIAAVTEAAAPAPADVVVASTAMMPAFPGRPVALSGRAVATLPNYGKWTLKA